MANIYEDYIAHESKMVLIIVSVIYSIHPHPLFAPINQSI